ncbi:tetratricopeptide repeat protein [Maioricimonas sp. JC845]|uniref:tetratricopeptide repeat protein n=1 Tax=Maioricimonas sp. JC845 TaxID=3232138 RepID=UPI0034585AC4
MSSTRHVLLGVLLIAGVGVVGIVLRQVVWSEPSHTSVDGLLQDGFAAAGAGNWDQVRALVRENSESPATGDAAKLLAALDALEHGRPREALRQLPVPGRDERIDAAAWPVRTDALYQLGFLREAEQLLQRRAERSPDNPLVHRWLAVIYYDLGAMDPAVRSLRTLTDLRPDDASSHFMLGTIFSDYERFSEAVESWQEYLGLVADDDPRKAEATQRLADAQMRLRDYEGALRTLANAERTGENLGRRAECLWNVGRRKEVETTLATARQLEQTGPRLALIEAQLLMERQEFALGLKRLSQVLADDPHDLQALHLQSQCYRQLGDDAAADAALERYNASEALLNELAELHRAAVVDVWNADLRDRLADLCAQLGKTDLAQMWQQAARACRQQQARSTASPQVTVPGGEPGGDGELF